MHRSAPSRAQRTVALALAGAAFAFSLPWVAPLFGCTVPDEFDPTGGDVALEVEWTVLGEPPVDACAEAGVLEVELRLFEQYAGGDEYTEDAWLVDCTAGSVITGAVLIPDTYRVGLYAVGMVDGKEEVVAASLELVEVTGAMVTVTLDLRPETPEE